MGVTKLESFLPKNQPKGDYLILSFGLMASCQFSTYVCQKYFSIYFHCSTFVVIDIFDKINFQITLLLK